ncbi:unnamed protein product [Cuscuta epithymum]|uniref:5-epiaristolochene synthase n=1 Tax=Cuscuta epithymum TaxID=186058 RepID=A0AAV0C9R3_9ASTE|nr:unnamed protein product [Cuscuta epithymum]
MLFHASTTCNTAEILKFIDVLERLGIAYHFEKEIEDQLHLIYTAQEKANDDELEIAALKFRLLRQHGFKISSDVFSSFVDTNNKFKDTSNVKDLLSLYEASFIRPFRRRPFFRNHSTSRRGFTYAILHHSRKTCVARPRTTAAHRNAKNRNTFFHFNLSASR